MLTPERQTCKILACAQARLTWGCSSAGRASRSQRGGRGFESHHLHHVFSKAVLTNGLFICRCAGLSRRISASAFGSRTEVRVALASLELHSPGPFSLSFGRPCHSHVRERCFWAARRAFGPLFVVLLSLSPIIRDSNAPKKGVCTWQ